MASKTLIQKVYWKPYDGKETRQLVTLTPEYKLYKNNKAIK